MTDSTLTVVVVYPEVLGTYGDRGNAIALAHRARARGIDCRVIEAGLDEPLPRAGDIYLIGGGEDAAMLLAWERLVGGRAVEEAVEAGAVCFGVCAGFQLLSLEFAGPDGRHRNGLGLLPKQRLYRLATGARREWDGRARSRAGPSYPQRGCER